MKKALVALAVLLAAAWACPAQAQDAELKDAPALHLASMLDSDDSPTLKDFAGQILVLEFWGTT